MLYLTLLLAGPVSVALLTVQLIIRLGSPRTAVDRTRRLSRVVTCLALTVIAHQVGIWESRLLLLRGADDICGVPRGEFVATDQSLFPLRNVCVVRSGPSFDLVPWWVNPLVGIELDPWRRTRHLRWTRSTREDVVRACTSPAGVPASRC